MFGHGRLGQDELIPGIDELVVEQNLMDVIWVCAALGESMFDDLEDMSDACGIVNIDVCGEPKWWVQAGEERDLKISILVESLEGIHQTKLRVRLMQ